MRVNKLRNLRSTAKYIGLFIAAICLFCTSPSAINAATFTVVNTNDSGPGSLRQAIEDANAAAGADTIDFDTAGVFATPQTIILTSGELVIVSELTISGPAADKLTISGNNTSRVFFVNNHVPVTLDGLRITGGFVDFAGGSGIWILNGTVTLINSTVFGNSSLEGGGIRNNETLILINSTVFGNSASGSGGGLYNRGTLTIINSTVSGNSGGSFGGGIRSTQGSKLTLINSTVFGNSSREGGGIFTLSAEVELNLNSSIVANNSATTSGSDIEGVVASGDYNLIKDLSGIFGLTGTHNVTGVDPMLGPLQYNGGPTMTHALLPGSPAIDAGSNPHPLATDQRGYLRTHDFGAIPNGNGDGTDIGAFELDPDTDGDGVRDFADNCVSTPNPEKIAFASTRDGNFEIYVMNADGSGQTRLTNSASSDFEPSFSPDGSKIVFASNRDGDPEIYVMNADGSGQTRLTNNAASDRQPSFSPDGSKIAFTSLRDGNPEVYVMNADGTGQTRLTNNALFDGNSSFSPDGSKIAFTSVRDAFDEIYVMNADGSGQTRLTNNVASDPSFSPDGSKIAFTSTRDGNPHVYVMNADGTGQTNLTNNAAQDWYPSWGPQADSDGDGVGDACEVQPTTTTIDPPAATQYSDVVTLSSTTTANGSPVTTGTVEFFVNGVSVGTDTVDANGVATLNTQILLAAGGYTVEAQYAANGDLLASSDTDSLNVTKENATVTASANNAASVKVNSPGGTAGQITLCANIADAADGSLGNIALAVPVTFVLAPVAPGSALQQQDAMLSSGQACATFSYVPVNVYDVSITVGGNYYTGSGSSVLAVFDPSLGFTTGGGRVLNPATGNTLHFGFSFKYDKNGFKGQMLVMEHLPSGEVVKLKSNSLSSLSIVGNQAIVLGKASISNGSGNLNFRLDVTDNGEPGSSDRFGLKLTTSGGSIIPAFTIDPPRTILGGNIQVPQGAKKP